MADVVCRRCSGRLPSRVEREARACARCIPTLVGQRDLWKQKQARTSVENLSLTASVRTLDENYSRLRRLLEVEDEGHEAGSHGVGPEQCPYPDGDERTMWHTGWAAGATPGVMSQVLEVLDRAVRDLETIAEIATGEGHGELSQKVTTVASLLRRVGG